MKDKIEGLGNGRVIIQRDFDQLETELQEARTQISGFQREKIRHDDEIALARFRVSTLELIIEDIQNDHKMPPKRTSTSAASAITQATIRKLAADSVAAALETQAANMANIDNTNRNPSQRTAAAEKMYLAKSFMSCQPFLLQWEMEDEFYNLVVKGNDLKTYARRFQELATLCPNMVPNNEKLMEVFIGGLPQSIEGTVSLFVSRAIRTIGSNVIPSPVII
ncbi:hypothetical protein Tco_0481920 [Tanacetum coccineum]